MAMRLERLLLGNPTGAGPSRTKRLKVDVTSDFSCPFCLLAVKQLQLAVVKYNTIHLNETLEVRYRFLPYQLNPQMSDEPVARSEHLRRKFGEKKAGVIKELVEEKLKGVGYEVHSDRCEVSSTHLAHRLLTYALRTDPSTQLPLAMNLFEAHHLDGQHLSDKDFLAFQAMLFNLFPTAADARQWLASDECDAEVRRAYASAHRLGVTGVPFFVFQQRYAASGAMGVDDFVKLLEEISKREELSPSSSSAPSPTSTLGGISISDKHRHNAHILHHAQHQIPSHQHAPYGISHHHHPQQQNHQHQQQHQHQHQHQHQQQHHPHQLPRINGSPYPSHRHHPYRSHSPVGEVDRRLPSPLSQGSFKRPTPPRTYPPADTVAQYTPYRSSRSPASTGYSAPSPGVSAERSTAAIGI